MKRAAKTLRMIATAVLALSCIVYFAAAIIGIIITRDGSLAFRVVHVMSGAIGAGVIGGALFAVAWVIDTWPRKKGHKADGRPNPPQARRHR